jgi:alkylated DNA nucleotide flippase Atl1
MNLDCNTELGRKYISYQHECLDAFCGSKNLKCVTTDDSLSADIDAVFYRKNIIAIAECKTRNLTMDQLKRFGSYLITYAKIEKLRALTKSLQCYGLLIVYLIPDKRIVWWKVCDKDGTILVNLNKSKTSTQATCNGGVVIRENAYIPLNEMLVI